MVWLPLWQASRQKKKLLGAAQGRVLSSSMGLQSISQGIIMTCLVHSRADDVLDRCRGPKHTFHALFGDRKIVFLLRTSIKNINFVDLGLAAILTGVHTSKNCYGGLQRRVLSFSMGLQSISKGIIMICHVHSRSDGVAVRSQRRSAGTHASTYIHVVKRKLRSCACFFAK